MCNKRKHSDSDDDKAVVDNGDGEKDAKVAKVDAENDQRDSGSCDGATGSKRESSDSDGEKAAVDKEGGEEDARIAKTSSENDLRDPDGCDGNSEEAGSLDVEGGGTDGGSERAEGEGSDFSEEVEESEDGDVAKEEPMRLKVTYKKVQYEVTMPPSATILELKEEIEKLSGVPYIMQKLIFKGCKKPEDNKSLRDSGLEADSKIMLVGSTVVDVMKVMSQAVQKPPEKSPKLRRLPLCQQEKHKRVLQDGVPEDAMPGILDCVDPLPNFPITGMLDKHKRKVRLTFQRDLDQLWISTKESTDKIPMEAIVDVKSEPILGHEEYHMVGFELGPTEGSRYWVYWVPAQYVEAIKDAILGELGHV